MISKETKLEIIFGMKTGPDILTKHGVPCVSCPMAKMELDKLSIGQVCSIYDLNLDGILSDLNSSGSK